MRVVEPSIVGVILNVFAGLTFFLRIDINRVWATGSVAVPLSQDRVL